MASLNNEVRDMLSKGQDPKEMVQEHCKPNCVALKEKLQRCESKLKQLTDVGDKSCMYPFRDYVGCLDGCAISQIFPNLVGNERGFLS